METHLKDLWHHLHHDEVLETLETHEQQGLTDQQARERLETYGPNTLTAASPTSWFKRLLLQFHNPLIYILLIATAVTLALGEYIDSAVIFGVVLINAIIGFVQESKAEDAIQALRGMLSSSAAVIRDGNRITIAAVDLVPGDIVLLASGDKVPADLRLLSSRDLQIDESTLTGESVPVDKQPGKLVQDTVLADRANMGFAGTLVTYGTGRGVVIGTGDRTETGKIAGMINDAVSLDTPLTRKINGFSRILLWVILVLAGITFGVGLLYGQHWVDTFIAAVALAVAAIPEGLPAVVTITLAIGVRRMALRNAIIRKLPAVETLGSTTVICSDKTGTLTENQMTVQRIIAGDTAFELTGGGYDPDGRILQDGSPVEAPATRHQALHHCLLAGLLSNDSELVEQDGRWTVHGDPTEGALIASALKAGFDRHDMRRRLHRVDAIPFESDRQYMATLHRHDEGHRVYMKGSAERVIAHCDRAMNAEGERVPMDQGRLQEQAEALAAQGLRVLAFAMRETDASNLDVPDPGKAEDRLIFLGLQAMIDPPREEVIHSVALCRKAGIRVKMITGDHALTARAIAERIGIIRDGEKDQRRALTGRQLAEMQPDELSKAAEEVSVFARVAPEQKLRLVEALQARGHVVAMTGDGVNDAPALKRADIGIAMGINGTEVSRDASDMVLADDNFSSIEAAVEEGRNVFDNLIKFITWILPTNLGQGLVIMVAILLGLTLPVLPVQALWLNMTTAVFLGLMLAFEPREPGIMTRAPRLPDAPILSWEIIGRIFSVSALLLLGAFGLFQWSLSQGAGIEEARTLAVSLFVVVQSFFLLNCRSLTRSVFRTHPFSNPWIWWGIGAMWVAQLLFVYTPLMNLLFQSAPLSLQHWGLILAYGVFVLLVVELEKGLWRWRKRTE
ncbi:cation-transporting P-type ATPase [Ectothiorhodospira lacustris]|uniref:cation-transporting P-type ATPase n=1 Tax=Ectothiorhodospira lacustris TaxID=2899127 RepID=UPI001EE7BB18|nr:cation-transporting P-type ATPase [Ectothiorhodospira lacustris]MCG5499634.1 cation-transporting P-type ATPase [Ectothiorhodospira lacustris]MCG5509602.1 cation-transporting P-type ATPase [Ectothiorhodospira lacustris]MCG5521603.1 cation-transporting P-type ATPase [Ectothiorhodospira lacustris]